MTIKQIFTACAVLYSFSQSAMAMSDWAIDFQCDTAKWASAPTISGGLFDGRIDTECKFKANQGGTFAQLETALSREVIEKAEKIYSGPDATTYDGLAATHFDAEQTQKLDSLQAKVRADLHFATDGVRFVSATKSKVITATGMAKNLKSILTGCEIKGDGAGNYTAHFFNQVQIAKPTLVPTSLFKSEVMKGMEESAEERTDTLLTLYLQTL